MQADQVPIEWDASTFPGPVQDSILPLFRPAVAAHPRIVHCYFWGEANSTTIHLRISLDDGTRRTGVFQPEDLLAAQKITAAGVLGRIVGQGK